MSDTCHTPPDIPVYERRTLPDGRKVVIHMTQPWTEAEINAAIAKMPERKVVEVSDEG